VGKLVLPSHWVAGHLAVSILADGTFAASTVPVIVSFSGRCLAVR